VRPKRAIAGLLVAAFLAAFAAPCLAASDDAHAAMACCKKMGSSDCGDARLAQACCKAKGDNQNGREIQPVASAAGKTLVAVCLAAADTPTSDALTVVGAKRLPELAFRSDGLSVRSQPLRI
jgi:hypothetical protein